MSEHNEATTEVEVEAKGPVVISATKVTSYSDII